MLPDFFSIEKARVEFAKSRDQVFDGYLGALEKLGEGLAEGGKCRSFGCVRLRLTPLRMTIEFEFRV